MVVGVAGEGNMLLFSRYRGLHSFMALRIIVLHITKGSSYLLSLRQKGMLGVGCLIDEERLVLWERGIEQHAVGENSMTLLRNCDLIVWSS